MPSNMLNIAGDSFRNYTQKHHFYHIFHHFFKFINYPVTKPHWIASFSLMLWCISAKWSWRLIDKLGKVIENIETSRTEFEQQMRSLGNCPRTCLWIVFRMAYCLIPDAILFEFGPFLRNSTRVWPTDGRTDVPTDRRTDGRTHPLKEMRERIWRWFLSMVRRNATCDV